MDEVKEGMKLVSVREEDAYDRVRYKQMFCCGNPLGQEPKGEEPTFKKMYINLTCACNDSRYNVLKKNTDF